LQLLSLSIRLVVLGALLWLAVFDVRFRRLPTKPVLMIGALFFVNFLVVRMPIGDFLAHLLLAFVALMFCAALFAAKMLGGGDAKLSAVVFLWVGPGLGLPTFVLISLIGLVVALISLATKPMQGAQRFWPMRALALFSGSRGVPYGVAIALGGGSVIVLPALLNLTLRR
jgi:prepilin peptidase CpaA